MLPSLVGNTDADIYLREGGLVLLPSGNGGFFDLWNIGEHRCIKSNVRPEDPIPNS